MRYIPFIGLFIALLFTACTREPAIEVTLHECAVMPNGGRACAACFVIDGDAYVFGGRDSKGHYCNDLWRYSPASDTWTDLGTTPLTARVNPTACVCGDKVYLGLGFKGGRYDKDSLYLRDWWEYTPATKQWKALSNYPNHYTDRATSFVGEGALYVGYGFCWNYRRDMFRYDIATNRWDSVDVGVDFHGYPTRSFGGTGCTCAGRHFMGTGYYRHSINWWAEFLPEGRWVKRKEAPGRTRTLAASAATNRYIYLCGGMHYGGVNTQGEILEDMWRYDPNKDSWQRTTVMPKRLMNHICFASNGKVYFGLGEDEDFQTNNILYYFAE